MEKVKNLSFLLNHKPVSVEVAEGLVLLDLLREVLRLTGAKRGCGEGECGACTVLVDDEAVCSCIYPAWKVENRHVLTVEGLSDGQAGITPRK